MDGAERRLDIAQSVRHAPPEERPPHKVVLVHKEAREDAWLDVLFVPVVMYNKVQLVALHRHEDVCNRAIKLLAAKDPGGPLR